ncbi:isoleucine--tRNA ligase [soil metagenome]
MSDVTKPLFTRVAPDVDLPRLDHAVLELWKDTDAFHGSVERRPADSEYTFYDGPPFATGTMHYGHVLQAVIKDVVPRYWTMRGHRVARRFGWDTHGLPVEMEVERMLGISGPVEIAEYGIDRYNAACRALVEHAAAEWEAITTRVGRWVDFEDDYRTMDPTFMETVWWVFRTLWDKGLVYHSFKVLPYSWGAVTPLSNFEVNLGGYRDVEDPSLTVRLEVVDGSGPVEPGDRLAVWTTTPWTIPANLGVGVGTDIEYAAVRDGGHRTWVAADLAGTVFESPEVLARTTGAEMVGATYQPAFPHFADLAARGAFVVIPLPEATTEEGTGLVHLAPAFGEADLAAFAAAGIDLIVDPVDAQGNFTDQVPEVAGMNIKDADRVLVDMLETSGALLRNERIVHAYPFCYRTDTPLIYKAIPTWFVAVETFRHRMAQLNEEILWVPEVVGTKRFGNWLTEARDWAVSRNRYWGSCIPVWVCDTGDHQVCIGSRAELQERSGVWLEDLHREFVDPVTFRCDRCDGTMTRIPEVLDCWFESGSMPYAQIHYPFENQERFARRFPADFIAEGLDQTRGWFYTLVVLAAALFDQIPFRNCVVTGLILAEDGRKMSKRLKNYPEPDAVLDTFGADALRAYLIDSPLVRADPLRFSEDGVRSYVRSVLLPLWNAFSFFTTFAEADGITAVDLAAAPPFEERPELDRWIMSVLQSLIASVNDEMERYRLFAVINPILGFVDELTNWYIRRSRRRFWSKRTGTEDADKLAAFATLYEVLVTFAKVAAPVLPFVTEHLYQTLVRPVDQAAPVSIHHTDYPVSDETVIDVELETDMRVVRAVANLGHSLRRHHEVRVRQPLAAVTVVTRDERAMQAVVTHRDLIAEELNVKTVLVDTDESAVVELTAKPNFRLLGRRLGAKTREVAAAIEELDHASVERIAAGETLTVAGQAIGPDDVVVRRQARPGRIVGTEGPLCVALDDALDPALVAEGMARDLISRIQAMRRDLGLAVTDRIEVGWDTPDPGLAGAVEQHRDLIAAEVLATGITRTEGGNNTQIGASPLTLTITPV